ncbi:MAG: GNAT family N-acyltransferase [Brachymonas denitrificans]|uniref:GNAT family N-acetyltransferase n=1 Tax=Brachymonas denitrificans TaxID=28220 RepID=UPI001BD02EBB|nr:GNAT family N-acyltransferase [Brachymonas denitrificans]
MKELPTPTFDLSPRMRGLPALLRKPLRKAGAALAHARPISVAPASTPEVSVSPVVLPAAPALVQPATMREAASSKHGLDARWARNLDEVREAQRLRYQVFAEEMGATLKAGIPGHDIDLFDDYCEHLLVRDLETGMVVGTYRVLTPAQARRVGSIYSDAEFDLVRLRHLRASMVELGRSCVHADYRSGGVILTLWGALAEFMGRNQLDTMVGCASIPMTHHGLPSGYAAASIWQQVRQTHLAPIEYHVTPRLPLPVDELQSDVVVEPPALIKGYLRLGAKVLGAPAWDPDFNTADLPMMMRVADLPSRYRRQFDAARS